MNIPNLFKIALKALANNKMRGFLTMLGIIIGVASVISMLAIGQGSKDSIREQISEMGSNMIMVQPGGDMRFGARQSASSMETLKLPDFEAIRREARYINGASPTVTASGQFINGAQNHPSTLYGVNEDYLRIRHFSLDNGAMFSEQEIASAAKVCIIGQTLVRELFPDGSDPVGRVVRFQKIPFLIIGTLKSKGANAMGMDQDDMVFAPYSTVQKRVLAITHLHGITASAIKEEYSERAISEISAILRSNHRLKPTDDDDFTIRSMEEIASTMSTVMDTLTILLGSVAGISLLVGGIGIMNIMYVSVTERTREIGLRMSIGAKSRDILAQFLLESILISLTGGIIGALLGGLFAALLTNVVGLTASVQPWSVILSFGVCTLTGVFFGWYPARKASGLDPIDALRYE
ncbi:MAG: ABC transporter permease [Tannerellaceae bacterium]|jgi:putative ABC transport system permease protein|nr:ABC transporter permease [Tannerellaceae bacterium]